MKKSDREEQKDKSASVLWMVEIIWLSDYNDRTIMFTERSGESMEYQKGKGEA